MRSRTAGRRQRGVVPGVFRAPDPEGCADTSIRQHGGPWGAAAARAIPQWARARARQEGPAAPSARARRHSARGPPRRRRREAAGVRAGWQRGAPRPGGAGGGQGGGPALARPYSRAPEAAPGAAQRCPRRGTPARRARRPRRGLAERRAARRARGRTLMILRGSPAILSRRCRLGARLRSGRAHGRKDPRRASCGTALRA